MTIDRRDFLRGAALASTALFAGASARADAPPMSADWRVFQVTTRIEPDAAGAAARAWIPLPSVYADGWIRPLGDSWRISGGKAARENIGPYGAALVAAEFSPGAEKPVIEVVSRVATRDRAVDLSAPGAPRKLDKTAQKLFTAPTRFLPTDGIVRDTAQKIVGDAPTDVEKARRIYEWVVLNTHRDPKTRGCGQGDIAQMLKTGELGGKCADINGLFVGLLRATGVPARDLYGLRVAASRRGSKSLGAASATVTKAQHCRAEVFLSGFGWVPMDPADVRKFVLEEVAGGMPLESDAAARTSKFLFGAWETNWIAWNRAHDVKLPGAKDELAFLMYPQVETAQGRRDCLDPEACRYSISAREIVT
ncbi:transglutaminase-like putative cysteine protease [Rhodoblastus acidophilus]|uniref:transglutaminase-like domain-containing protein n=1 Tax=Rhodoblastus acidophilus TaxID=1074 RepID=UPI0029CAB4A7|nr:transglutaminase-like domain-containing protein [Rhodoblastus acidophilus]MCW2285417.1 transglutaminase-like putative cysteine protease [Rhodoblastus acidophilus]MCW2334334.1 transglutaminase-like putative cysteine protease [Rhodoblastus acidophilus]